MRTQLNNDDKFPDLSVSRLGGGILNPVADLAGGYGVILIYRGAFCPFCNDQIAAFASAAETLAAAGINVVAFSVDDAETATAFAERHRWPYPLGYSADLDAVVAATGAYDTSFPGRGHFLETTGFVLAPDGTIISAVYASRAIGRLAPNDVVRLVTFWKSRSKQAAPIPRKDRPQTAAAPS